MTLPYRVRAVLMGRVPPQNSGNEWMQCASLWIQCWGKIQMSNCPKIADIVH